MRLLGGILAVGALLLGASAASGQVRYAAPTGEGEACTATTPCSLKQAVTKAKSNDEVIVGAGTYDPNAVLSPEGSPSNIYIHGDFGGPMPQIGVAGSYASLYSGASGRTEYLKILSSESGGSPIGCGQGGVVRRIEAISEAKNVTAIGVNGECTVLDSLARANGEGASAISIGTLDPSTVTIRNVTAIAGAPGSKGLSSLCGFCSATPNEVDIRNTIASGAAVDIEASFQSEITVAYSNFDKAVTGSESATIVNVGSNQAASPLFIDSASGNYRQSAGSPTIDAGVVDQLGATDLDGAARVQGPAPDIGAYEMPVGPRPERTEFVDSRLLSLTVGPRKFKSISVGESTGGGILKSNPPVRTGVTFALSAPATATFTVERKLKGRRVGQKCVKQTRTNRSKKRCPRFQPVRGSFAVDGGGGDNRFTFTGKVGGKALERGRYRLVGSAGGEIRRSPFQIAGVFRPAPK